MCQCVSLGEIWTHYHGAFSWQNGYLAMFLSANNQHKMTFYPYVLEIGNIIYGNGLAMLDSLVTCTVYTNKLTFGQLQHRLGL